MDSDGGPAAALASLGTSGSHSVGVPLTAKHKTFAPHIPRNRDNKRRRMRGAVPSPGPADKSNHKFQNDAANHSNHKPQSNDPNGCNSTKPKESHETIPYSEITAGKKNKHWNDHNSTNPKESHEVASPSERAAKKRSYTWHRGETVQDTVEEDNTAVEGHIHSKLDTFSRPQDVPSNGRHFNGPSWSFYSHSQDQDIRSQRDSCYKLWNKLEATYDARERHVYKKEEELAKREQAVRTQEEIVAHWRTQAQAERLEAAYMRQEAYAERLRLEEETKRLEKLKADIEQIRDGIFSRQMANDLSKDVLTNHDGGQNFHVKMELPQIDYHDDERISGQSGDGISKVAVQSMQCGVEMPQNYLNTLENKGDESLEAMGDPSQCCVDTSQVKLDISAKAYEHSVGTMESNEVSVSEVSGSNVSEKRHFSQHRCSNEFSKEIVNRSLESPGFCAADIAVMGNSDPLPSEPTIVDVCQGSLSFLTSVGDKEPMPQLSSQSKDGSRLNDVPAFQSSLHAETLICTETELNLNNTESSMATPKISAIPVQVKVENIEHEQHPSFIPNRDCKSDFFEDCTSDELDHVSLEERKKLCTETFFNMDVDTKWLRADSSQAGESDFGEAWKEKARNFTLKRNKRKTKICSVETALEEDAPGLLQVLRQKGVMEEIKLYGDFIDEDLLGLANEEDSFKDLESIIEKLWGRPSGLFKVVRARQTTNKPNYCLSCLLSLIEQTRSLQNHKWPVEWGWCRQLQSFVFVFERHNRIVLERPEYGYATYFFELVQSLPIKWQVGRLITVMSIATCGRTALLENKPLEIGQDLNAEEASILEDYGWTPNSGLASLLNYCNRVVHDRKVDDDDMEWRSKIGKLLMDGHAGGRIAKANIPKKLQSFISVINFEGRQ